MVGLLLLFLVALLLLLSSWREQFIFGPPDPRAAEYRAGMKAAEEKAVNELIERNRRYGYKRTKEWQKDEARRNGRAKWNQTWQEMLRAEAAAAAAASATQATAAPEMPKREIHGLPYSGPELNQFYADFPQSGKDAFIPGLKNLQGQTQAQMDAAKVRVDQNVKKFLGDMVNLMFIHYYTPLNGGAVTDAGIDAAVADLQQKQIMILDMPPPVLAGLLVVFKKYFKSS